MRDFVCECGAECQRIVGCDDVAFCTFCSRPMLAVGVASPETARSHQSWNVSVKPYPESQTAMGRS